MDLCGRVWLCCVVLVLLLLRCLCFVLFVFDCSFGWYFWFPGLPARSSTLAKTEVVLPPLFTTLRSATISIDQISHGVGTKNVFLFLCFWLGRFCFVVCVAL